MQDKYLYQKTYRIATSRLGHYDYAAGGVYFITICAKDMQCLFGKIMDLARRETQDLASLQQSDVLLAPKIIYNQLGNCACECWRAIPNHFPFVELGSFVVMPNHLHGVLFFNKSKTDFRKDARSCVSRIPKSNEFAPQTRNLASVIRGFKVGVTKFARKHTDIKTVWHKGYYDHVVRNEEDLLRINEYIEENPIKWLSDKYYAYQSDLGCVISAENNL